MAYSSSPANTHYRYCNKNHIKSFKFSYFFPTILSQQQLNNNNKINDNDKPNHISRREIILRSSEIALLGAIFKFSGTKPQYLGVQKNYPALALCPATKNCISTSENISDLTHYAPPWNYNPEEGRGGTKPVSRETAMEELLQVIKSTKPDKFRPHILERKDDYIHVEYESPILGFVDDVEFWFPPGKKSIVEYRSASRLGNFDFDVNRKRIKVREKLKGMPTFHDRVKLYSVTNNSLVLIGFKALRQELEKKGWSSDNIF